VICVKDFALKIEVLDRRPFIEITTNSCCIMNCHYCPQEVFKRAYKGRNQLSLSDFQSVVRELPKNIIVTFSGFSEPFLNQDCVDMIEYAKSLGHQVHLYSTLVGLNIDDIDRLKGKVDLFWVHLPDNLNNAKIPITENYKSVLIKTLKDMRVDGFSVMNESFNSNDRAGSCNGAKQIKINGWFNCSLLKTGSFVMLPNCDAVLCCMDFGLRHKIGNLLLSSYQELLDCEVFKKIRRNRLQFSGDVLCRRCYFASPLYKDVIRGFVGYSYKLVKSF